MLDQHQELDRWRRSRGSGRPRAMRATVLIRPHESIWGSSQDCPQWNDISINHILNDFFRKYVADFLFVTESNFEQRYESGN